MAKHSSIMHLIGINLKRQKKRFKAFTLAEVLITLGVIGVVAALTIPTIMTNMRNKSYVTQLRNSIAIIDEGFKLAIAEDATGADNFMGTELFAKCNGDNYGSSASDYQKWADDCFPVLQRYFKDVQRVSRPEQEAIGDYTNIITDTATCKRLVGVTNKWWYLNDHTKCRGWKNMSYTLLNGARIDVAITGANPWTPGGITLDVNGDAPPNTWGRDAFYLRILSDGTVTPIRSKRYYEECTKYNGAGSSSCTLMTPELYNQYCSKTSTEDGIYCGARIIDDGWQMKY